MSLVFFTLPLINNNYARKVRRSHFDRCLVCPSQLQTLSVFSAWGDHGSSWDYYCCCKSIWHESFIYVVFRHIHQLASFFPSFLTPWLSAEVSLEVLKGYSSVNLIHGLTHRKTDSLSRDKVCRPLANVVLASSETTARQQHTAVNGSKYKTAIEKAQIMLRTAPNFTNFRNRVPAHILRHQTLDIVAVFGGKYKQNSPPEKPSLLWRSPVSRFPSAVESRSNDHHWAAELYCTR